jgi:hypothetical protein
MVVKACCMFLRTSDLSNTTKKRVMNFLKEKYGAAVLAYKSLVDQICLSFVSDPKSIKEIPPEQVSIVFRSSLPNYP